MIKEYLYESQISLLISGIDEWFWSAYLCLDTFFEGKENLTSYCSYDSDALIDGAMRPNRFPIWNPRQNFLFKFSRRFRQATKEWTAIVRNLESRLHTQVCMYQRRWTVSTSPQSPSPSCTDITQESGIFRQTGEAEEALQDDRLFSRTRKYTDITRLLRLLHNGLIRTIESWEEFEVGELGYFQDEESTKARALWENILQTSKWT